MIRSKAEVRARAQDLVQFRTPALWRYWPFLPVVRAHPTGEGRQLGVLYDASRHRGRYGFSATVYLGNLFLLPSDPDKLMALPKYVYDTADELVDAGWRAD